MNTRIFKIYFNAFEFLRPAIIIASIPQDILLSFLAFRGNIHYSIKGLAPLRLEQGQFSVLHSNQRELTARFEKNILYQSVVISWTTSIVKNAVAVFPVLSSLFTEKQKPKSFYIPGKQTGVSVNAINVVQRILKAPFDAGTCQYIFYCQVMEYLYYLLEEPTFQPPFKNNLSPSQQQQIRELAEKLRMRPSERFPIHTISSDLGIDTTKLKKVFKAIFGKGIFEYHLDARMEEAHRLLTEGTLPIKAVAITVGYKRTTNFIEKFTEYFGYPPSLIMQNRKES